MDLRLLLGDELYNEQKELFNRIVDGGKREIKKHVDDIYIINKDVLPKLHVRLIIDSLSMVLDEEKRSRDQKYDWFCDQVSINIHIVGKIVAFFLRKYKDKLLEVIF